jgi:hypothetical protein
MKNETISTTKPKENKFIGPTYAAGLISLSFIENDLNVTFVVSDKNSRMMAYQSAGLPFGKEEEGDNGLVHRTIRREYAEETREYPRIPIEFGFTLHRPDDNHIGVKFPNHFYYGWEDAQSEVNEEVIFTAFSDEPVENGKISIVPKERVSQIWKESFLSALSPALRPQQRMAIIEFYHLLKAGLVKGHEHEVARFMEKHRFDLTPIYEAFERPTKVEHERGAEKYFRTLVVKDNCGYVLDPGNVYHCDFLTPKKDASYQDTKKLVWYEHKGVLHSPKETIEQYLHHGV